MTEKQESKISQTKLIAVGIDVAKDTLAVCKRFLLNDGKTKERLILRKKIRLIASLEKQLQQLGAITLEHRKTVETLGMELSVAERQVIDTIDNLRKQKDQLEREVELGIEDDDDKDAQNINSIPGVSSYVASLVAIFFSKDYDQSAKQWIAYAGMDVSVNQSGKWHGRCRLTKRGNPYLRKRLFSAAWGATMHNEKFKEYYDYLKNNKGRKHVEALTIIARKLLRIMFNLVQNNTVFDASKLKFEMPMN